MVIDIKNLDDSIISYSLLIKPPKYRFKILTNSINLNFEESIKSKDKIFAESEILIDSKDLDIKATFSNNGIVTLKKDKEVLTGYLITKIYNNISNVKKIKVIGSINKKDLNTISNGEYIGEAELFIEIDS